jgi:hypothetical protein
MLRIDPDQLLRASADRAEHLLRRDPRASTIRMSFG